MVAKDNLGGAKLTAVRFENFLVRIWRDTKPDGMARTSQIELARRVARARPSRAQQAFHPAVLTKPMILEV